MCLTVAESLPKPMKMSNYLVIPILLLATSMQAQEFDADSVYYTAIPKSQSSKKPLPIFRDTLAAGKYFDYFFNVNMGPLIGCDDCISKDVMFSFSTIHGVTIGRKLRTGLGAGLDSYYTWNAIPLFGNVSFDFAGSKNTHALFIQMQYGWAHAWHQKSENEWGLADTRGGTYLCGQLGYRLRYHSVRFAILAGVKQQRVLSHFEYPGNLYYEDGTWKSGPSTTRDVKTRMDRFVITLSVGWN